MLWIQRSLVASSTWRTGASVSVAAMGLIWASSQARANLVIVPTFDPSITNLATAAAIESSINATISRVEADISNNVTVSIDFQNVSGGLGESATSAYADDYTSYRSVLSGNQILSTDDKAALATLPISAANPVDNNSSSSIFFGSANYRALGQDTPGYYGPGVLGNGTSTSGTFDGVVGVNTAICNVSRTGAQNSSYYDLQAVVGHEVDEVLGIGGTGSDLYLDGTYSGQSPYDGYIGALDLFRYASAGVRSFTLDPTANAYFSVDGGNTNFVYFNQNNSGSDFSDWGNGSPNVRHGNSPAQLQDAFGGPGVDVNIGPNELAALDVIGWNLTPAGLALEAQVPEPAMIGALSVGVLGLLGRRRRVS